MSKGINIDHRLISTDQNGDMAFDLIFCDVSFVSDGKIQRADIGISNGVISEIGTLDRSQAQELRETAGLTMIPGGIDTQVHFREPGLTHKEDLESGSRAALHGGITAFLEMPNTKPETTTPEALSDKLQRASGRCWSNYGFFVGASPSNAQNLAEYENLPGTPGIKIFMGSSTGDLLVSQTDDLKNVLSHGKKRCPVHAEDEPRNVARKALLSSHPSPVEHPFLRDAESARLATERLIRLCEETGRPVHILHISTADELPLIADAKRKGLPVTCEVTPQHLWFAAPDCYERLGTKAQMNPPLRSEEHRAGLWRALNEGLFDVFGSDHAPHTLEEKSQPYPSSPSGMPGVETLIPVLLTYVSQGKISLEKVVTMLSERPAEMYAIQGKGKIAVGFDADVVLVDLNKEWQVNESSLQSKCGWSPYNGEKLTGAVDSVYLKGELALQNGVRVGTPKGEMLTFGSQA